MPTLELYPFKFRDPLTGKWLRARRKLRVPELQRRYAEWEITGAPEIRHVTETSAQPFNPSVAPHSQALSSPKCRYGPMMRHPLGDG